MYTNGVLLFAYKHHTLFADTSNLLRKVIFAKNTDKRAQIIVRDATNCVQSKRRETKTTVFYFRHMRVRTMICQLPF